MGGSDRCTDPPESGRGTTASPTERPIWWPSWKIWTNGEQAAYDAGYAAAKAKYGLRGDEAL